MDFKRPDGRLPTELRDIVISFDGLDGVDGSARFGFGDTKALASVSGPMEVRLAAEQANKATFEVLVRPLSGLPGTDSKALASALRNALLPSMILTSNPRTLVQLVALALTPVPTPRLYPSLYDTSAKKNKRRGRNASGILRSSPSLVAALINASSLALLNASSVPLRGVVCACSVGRVRTEEENDDDLVLIVDPSPSELNSLDGAGTFAFLITGTRSNDSSRTSGIKQSPSQEEHENAGQVLKPELVWFQWNASPFDEDRLARATELARAGALRVREHMRGAVEAALFGLDGSRGNSKDVKVKKEDVDDDAKMEI